VHFVGTIIVSKKYSKARQVVEERVNQHFKDDLCSPHQFHDKDEDRHGLRYVALLTIQPPGAAASPRICY
jgi:hypothetical protein